MTKEEFIMVFFWWAFLFWWGVEMVVNKKITPTIKHRSPIGAELRGGIAWDNITF